MLSSQTSNTTLRYKRVLLKLSGEILAGERGMGIDPTIVSMLVAQIKEIHLRGVQVGIVIGGGNIFRGAQAEGQGLDRVTGDYMGMMATAINGLALQDALEQVNVDTRLMSAIEMRQISEPYIKRRATRHLEKGRVVIFSCGTGNPFFTTDTAASLRAMEVGAEVLLKGTKVDAIYDKDPKKDTNAVPYKKVSFMEVIQRGLKVMDTAAISLCMDNQLPIIVFNVAVEGNLSKIISGEAIGTLVEG